VPGRLTRVSIATAIAACVGAATLPAGANAGPVNDLLGGIEQTVNDTVNGLLGGSEGGGTPSPSPAPSAGPTAAPAPAAAEADPTISGTDPHATGTVLDANVDIVDLTPGEEDVIVGESSGEQDSSGAYHGRVVPVSALGLGVAVIETDEGESATSPLMPINDLLDEICAGSGNNVCLNALQFSSDTTGSGSENTFSAANANLLNGVVETGLLESEGSINEAGGCQTASSSSGSSLGIGNGAFTVEALQSSSDSQACNDGSRSAAGDSEVLNLDELDALDPLELLGCSSTAVDDEFGIPVVLEGVCNGDDTNGAQAEAPYNTRRALGIDVLPGLEAIVPGATGLLGVNGSTSESLAEAPGDEGPECPDPGNPDCPPVDECPDPSNPDCPDGPDGTDDACPDPDNPDCPGIEVAADNPSGGDDAGGPGGPGGPSGDSPGDDNLAFTGADMGLLGAIGLGVMAIGLALMALADRRRRAAGTA
jgi:hypothetical protein